jgi:hypothetical protein
LTSLVNLSNFNVKSVSHSKTGHDQTTIRRERQPNVSMI